MVNFLQKEKKNLNNSEFQKRRKFICKFIYFLGKNGNFSSLKNNILKSKMLFERKTPFQYIFLVFIFYLK